MKYSQHSGGLIPWGVEDRTDDGTDYQRTDDDETDDWAGGLTEEDDGDDGTGKADRGRRRRQRDGRWDGWTEDGRRWDARTNGRQAPMS